MKGETKMIQCKKEYLIEEKNINSYSAMKYQFNSNGKASQKNAL